MTTNYSYQYIAEANVKSKEDIKVENPVGVFVGGTSGIGEYSAYSFAKFTKNATIYIVGRNDTAGEKIITKLRELQPECNAKFLKCDLSLVKNAVKFAEELTESETKINTLVVSAGSASFSSAKSDEGLSYLEAVAFISRWKIVDILAPLVSKAGETNEPARIENVLRVTPMYKLTESDIDMNTERGFIKMVPYLVKLSNLATFKFSRMYPNISVSNIYPGPVKSNLSRSLPWILRSISEFVSNLAFEETEYCGDRCHYIAFSGKEYTSGGAYILDNKLHDYSNEFEQKGCLSEEDQDKALKYIQEKADKALNS